MNAGGGLKGPLVRVGAHSSLPGTIATQGLNLGPKAVGRLEFKSLAGTMAHSKAVSIEQQKGPFGIHTDRLLL